MRLKIDKSLSLPVYVQIKNSIKELILTGKLPAGFVLPPERKLAASIDVNRSTVINAYDELKAIGLVESHRGKGTVITQKIKPDAFNETQEKYVAFKQAADLHTDSFAQRIDAKYLELFDIEAHIQKSKAVYLSRREKMVECINILEL